MRFLDLWLVDLGEPIGVESAYLRPAIVIGSRRMTGPLALVCPITITRRDYPWRVEIDPTDDNGLSSASYVQTEHVRSISSARGIHRIGRADPLTGERIRTVLRLLFDL